MNKLDTTIPRPFLSGRRQRLPYQKPTVEVFISSTDHIFLANSYNGSSINVDTSDMVDGDGSDAVRAYGIWDDIWE